MIFWIASYPKSGNTYIRSFLSAYYFSDSGQFDFELLRNIKQFPNPEFFDGPIKTIEDAANNWIFSQRKIKEKKKIKMLKTHNFLGAYKGQPFTTVDYTLGAIYVVRDPRNVITSVMNHFGLNIDKAFEFMTDIQKGTSFKIEDDFSTYTFLSDWSNHYKSWAHSKNFRKLIIKYEDLEVNKYETFRDIVVFVNALLNRTERVDKKKLENAVKSTNFNVLKNLEKNKGFGEALYSEKDKKKRTFFNLGFNNRWKKLLREDIRENLESNFRSEMKELGYLD
tara:strand:+ start:370 stop:1209 length:840 start_codon:yes stop_codon:yes gene_type:complete